MSQNRNSTELPDNEIAGYLSNQKPITKNDFVKGIEKAEADIKEGQYVTLNDLKKESESW